MSYLPIDYGNGARNRSAWAGTVSASYLEDARNFEVQAAYTLNPRDTESLSPSLQLGSLTMAWWPGPSMRAAPFVGGGVGVLHMVPVEFNCDGLSPVACEWMPTFRRATFMTLVGVGGLDVSFGDLGVRIDARGHYPLGPGLDDDSERPRWEIGVGLRYFFDRRGS